MTQIEHKRVLVVGLGRSGEAAAQFLVDCGALVSAMDAKADLGSVAEKLRVLGVRLYLGSNEAAPFLEQDLIVVSPGVPWDLAPLAAAREHGIDVIGEVELAAPFLKGRVIGVTGANGKTTTTALIGHLLDRSGTPVQVGGNVGQPYPPVIAMVETSTPEMWNVIELSSFQLESIRTFRAHIGVALNVTPDHLDRHATFEHYAAAKARLFSTQQPGDFAVLNADDPTCASYARETRGQPVWFSRTKRVLPGAFVEEGWIVFENEEHKIRLAEVARIPIRGAHNLENTLAAMTASFLTGADPEALRCALPEFHAVEHRLEFVRRVDGVDYYNDSKATNVDATLKALEAFDGNLWVILGGKDKGSDYTVLRETLGRKARGVLLIGAAASKIGEQISGAAPLVEAGAIDRAVTHAARNARPGDTVLLAPACASFDQFDNYEHRGRVFKQLVRALEENQRWPSS